MNLNKETLTKFFKNAPKKTLDYIKIAKIELIVIAGIIFLDLLTKFIVEKTMTVGQTIVIIPNFLEFYYTINKKAAFGSAFGLDTLLGLDGVRILFLIITVIAMGALIFFIYFFRGKHILSRISLSLILAGAFGNFYDRLVLKGVRDFVQIVFFGLDLPLLGESFAIFNIADMSLVAGVIIFAVYFIFMYKSPKELFVGPVQQFPDKNQIKTDSPIEAENDTAEIQNDKYEPIKDVAPSEPADKNNEHERI